MIEFFQTDFVQDTTKCEIELFEIARKYMSQSFMEFTRLPFVQMLSTANLEELLQIVIKHDDKETEKLMKEKYSKNQNRG